MLIPLFHLFLSWNVRTTWTPRLQNGRSDEAATEVKEQDAKRPALEQLVVFPRLVPPPTQTRKSKEFS